MGKEDGWHLFAHRRIVGEVGEHSGGDLTTVFVGVVLATDEANEEGDDASLVEEVMSCLAHSGTMPASWRR